MLLGEPIGTVSSDLFSHFTEHLGGCIYDAVFYDDIFFVEYFYSKLRPCWRRNDREIGELLQTAVREYATLLEKCEQFDKELVSGLERTGGEAYAPGTWS